MVTMSTVGYGDVVCVTALGRGFQVLFLLVGLVSTEYSLDRNREVGGNFFFSEVSLFVAGYGWT